MNIMKIMKKFNQEAQALINNNLIKKDIIK